jgi:hypothetical protein
MVPPRAPSFFARVADRAGRCGEIAVSPPRDGGRSSGWP